VSYRDARVSVHLSVVAADPGDALRQTRTLIADASVALTLEVVQIGPAAQLDGTLSAAS
jgi:hypothetical protein